MAKRMLRLRDPKSKSISLLYFVARRDDRECDFIAVGIDDQFVTALSNEGQYLFAKYSVLGTDTDDFLFRR